MTTEKTWPLIRNKLSERERTIFLHAEGMLIVVADVFERLSLEKSTRATRVLAENAIKELSKTIPDRFN